MSENTEDHHTQERSISSSWSRAPFDVLAEIFSACHTSHTQFDKYWHLSYSEFSPVSNFGKVIIAWTLSYVCRHWRDTTLSLPDLWSSIVIRESQWGDSGEGIKSLLSLLIERSKNIPLVVAIDGAYSQIDDDERYRTYTLVLNDVLGFLSPHLSRARVLAFALPRRLGVESILFNFLSNSMGFPVLRTLSLYEQTPGVNWQPIAHVFAQATVVS